MAVLNPKTRTMRRTDDIMTQITDKFIRLKVKRHTDMRATVNVTKDPRTITHNEYAHPIRTIAKRNSLGTGRIKIRHITNQSA